MSIFDKWDDVPVWAQERVLNYQDELAALKHKVAMLEQELKGANETFKRISELVNYNDRHRDLIEAVELKIFSLKNNKVLR